MELLLLITQYIPGMQVSDGGIDVWLGHNLSYYLVTLFIFLSSMYLFLEDYAAVGFYVVFPVSFAVSCLSFTPSSTLFNLILLLLPQFLSITIILFSLP